MESLAALRNPYRNGWETWRQQSWQSRVWELEISREHTPQPAVMSMASSSQFPRHLDVQGTQPPLNSIAGQWGTFPSAAFGGFQGQPQFWPWPGPPCFAPMPPTQGQSTIVRPGPTDDLRSSNAVQHPFVMGPMAGLPYQQQYASPPQPGRPVDHEVTRGLYSRSVTTPMWLPYIPHRVWMSVTRVWLHLIGVTW